MRRAIVGVTSDVGVHTPPVSGRAVCRVALAYVECVTRAGGVAVVLPAIPELIAEHARMCDAFVFTGGDDPRMEMFGEVTHPKASPMDARRQAYEVGLLRLLEAERRDAPVLGICLGMQLMSLVSGGRLNQHLPETLATHADHYSKEHGVEACGGAGSAVIGLGAGGVVASHHRQAVSDPGRLEVVAVAEDGVIEAVADPSRAFCVGVQWHPERTGNAGLGQELFDRLVGAAAPGAR